MGAARANTRNPYPSDVTDEEWALLEPSIPQATPGGRPEDHPKREILHAIFSVLRAGCAWRLLPHDFPPWPSAYPYCRAWQHDGRWPVMHDLLRGDGRVAAGRHRQPSAGSIDSQSVKTTATGGATGTRHTTTSTAANALSSSRREGSCWPSWSRPPTCKTALGLKACWCVCRTRARACGACGPIRPIRATWPRGCGACGGGGRSAWRLSSGRRGPTASCSCPNGGSWSAPVRGSVATAVYPKMMNT